MFSESWLISIFFISLDEIQGVFNKRRTADGARTFRPIESSLSFWDYSYSLEKELWII